MTESGKLKPGDMNPHSSLMVALMYLNASEKPGDSQSKYELIVNLKEILRAGLDREE